MSERKRRGGAVMTTIGGGERFSSDEGAVWGRRGVCGAVVTRREAEEFTE